MGNIQDAPVSLCQEECHHTRTGEFHRDPYEQVTTWSPARPPGVSDQGPLNPGWRPSKGQDAPGMAGMRPLTRPPPPQGRLSPRGPPPGRRPGGPPGSGGRRLPPGQGPNRAQTMCENPYADYNPRSQREGDANNRSSSMFANPFKEYASLFGGEESSGSRAATERRGGSAGPGLRPGGKRTRGLPDRGYPGRHSGGGYGGPQMNSRPPLDRRGSRGPIPSGADGPFLPESFGAPGFGSMYGAEDFGWAARAPHEDIGSFGAIAVASQRGGGPGGDSSERRHRVGPGVRPLSPKRVEDTMIGKGFGEFLKRGVAQAAPKKEAERAEMVPSKDGGFIATIQKGFEGIFGHLATSKEEVLRKRGPVPATEYEAVPGDEVDQRVQFYARQIPRHLGDCLTIYRMNRGEYRIGEDEVRMAWQSRIIPPSREKPGGSAMKEVFVTAVAVGGKSPGGGGIDTRDEKAPEQQQPPSEPLPLFLRHSANVAYDLRYGNNNIAAVPEGSRLSFAETGTLLQDSDADAKFNAMQMATEQAKKREMAAIEWRKNNADATAPRTASTESLRDFASAASSDVMGSNWGAGSGTTKERPGGAGCSVSTRDPDDQRSTVASSASRVESGLTGSTRASGYLGKEMQGPQSHSIGSQLHDLSPPCAPPRGAPEQQSRAASVEVPLTPASSSFFPEMPNLFGPLSVPGLDPPQLKIPPPNWAGAQQVPGLLGFQQPPMLLNGIHGLRQQPMMVPFAR